jgi:signal transduction histidine kinase
VRITVADTGEGIPDSQLERIFEPFFTTKPGRSKGLGLTEVYGIVAQAGGHLSVESEPGQGTVIKVYLPTSSSPRFAGVEPRPSGGSNVIYRFPNPGDSN